jgi:peroxiredoxin
MMKKLYKVFISFLLIAIAAAIGSQAGKYFGKRENSKKKQVFAEQIISNMSDLNIGDTLPNHMFETIEGDSVWLYQLLSKRCVLIVSIPQCDDCYLEAEQLKSAKLDSVEQKKFIFVTWENPKLLDDVKKKLGLESLFLYDHKKEYFSQFDITVYPFNITLDENGVVLDLLAGSMLKEDFLEIIKINELAEMATN